jgi:hypothetical protein
MPNRRYDELSDNLRERFDRAAQYLAELGAAGLWKAAKSLMQYSYEEIRRKANAFHKQEQAGLPINNDAARGHLPQKEEPTKAPPETGRTGPDFAPAPGREQGRKIDYNPDAYRLIDVILDTPGASITSRGEVNLTNLDDYDTLNSALSAIADIAPDTRVFLEFDDGVIAYSHGGIRATELLRILNEEFDGDWQNFLDYLYEIMSHDSPTKKGA